MKKSKIKITEGCSVTLLQKRLFAIGIAVAFLFLCVLGRLLYVQVIWGYDLQKKALDQWTREIPVIAERGIILDRNGVNLVSNSDTFSIFVRKRAVKDLDGLADVLSSVLSLDKAYVSDRLTKTKSSEVTIKKQVDKTTLDKLLEYDLSGVYYSRDNSRTYPYNELLSTVLGFTSTDGKGQSGLELYYDKYLSGIDGEILYETDIVGIEIENGKATYVPAIGGLNLKLTVDYEIQQLCEAAMTEAMEIHGAKTACMLVLDPKTGAVLAMCNKPSMNLSDIPRNDLDKLNYLSRNSLVCDMYEPGSTFKVLTAAANIEEYLNGNSSAYSNSHIFSSARYRFVDGQRIKCWSNHQNGKHSALNLQGALNNSCNPIFVDIATSLGTETLYKYIKACNYGSVTGIDFGGESQGMVIPPSAVKNVDLARIAFGQTIAVTGIQIASATAAMINGGNYYAPYLVSEIFDGNGIIAEKIQPKLKNKVISAKASEILREMLEGVVESGSGKQAYIEGYRVAGKTGTSQKYENGVIAAGKYVSSFIGFFPANDPQYLALVVVDEPQGSYYGSTVAAPYAKQVFEGIINVKNIPPVKYSIN